MSFADLEQRANAAVMRRLSNARARKVGASSDFPVIFDYGHVETGAGISALQPLATALDADLVGVEANTTELEIKGSLFTVRDLRPDGTGLTVTVLEAA